MSVKSFGSLSFTSAGGSIPAATSTSSPKRAERPEPGWETTPSCTSISAASTPQLAAAAATRRARAVAPALRICSQELFIAVEPPVAWAPKERLA